MKRINEKSSELLKIPFGIHKGKDLISLMNNDPEYIKFLLNRPWFKDNFKDHYTLIINNFGEYHETPIHNAMQVKFLEEDYVEKFMLFLEKTLQFNSVKFLGLEFEPKCGGDIMLICTANHNKELVEKYDKKERIVYDKIRVVIEIKPSMGDDYPSVLRAVKRIDVPFVDKSLNHEDYYIRKDYRGVFVLIGEYDGKGVDLDNVKKIFMLDRIKLLQESDFI